MSTKRLCIELQLGSPGSRKGSCVARMLLSPPCTVKLQPCAKPATCRMLLGQADSRNTRQICTVSALPPPLPTSFPCNCLIGLFFLSVHYHHRFLFNWLISPEITPAWVSQNNLWRLLEQNVLQVGLPSQCLNSVKANYCAGNKHQFRSVIFCSKIHSLAYFSYVHLSALWCLDESRCSASTILKVQVTYCFHFCVFLHLHTCHSLTSAGYNTQLTTTCPVFHKINRMTQQQDPHNYNNNNSCLTAIFQDTQLKPASTRMPPLWILLEQG